MPKITKRLMAASRPRAKRYEIACSQIRGFILRVLPSGKQVFYFRVRNSGNDNKIRIGRCDKVSLSQARATALRLASIEPGEPLPLQFGPRGTAIASPAKTVEPPEPTFDDLAREFARRHIETRALRESTRDYYRRAMRDCTRRWGRRPLSTIRFADVEEWHRERGEHPSTANNAARVLRVAFEKARQWEMFTGQANPVDGLKLYREKKRTRYLRPEERVRLNAALEEAEQPWSANKDRKNAPPLGRWSHVYAVRLLLLTGFRQSEVLSLEWSWIDRERCIIFLPDSKTGPSPRVISPAVLELLDEIAANHRRPEVSLVLYGRRFQKIHPSSLRHFWGRIRAAAGLEDVHLHDLRHSAASAAIEAGCTLREVGALLGHKKSDTTARYAHLSDDAARRAASRMTDEIARAERKVTPNRRAKKP